jgi:hypothetical protein
MTEIIEHLKEENSHLRQHLHERTTQVQNFQEFIRKSREELNQVNQFF